MSKSLISHIRLDLLGADEIRERSVVEVNTKLIYDKNLPKQGGLNDHRMGTVDPRYRCGTCFHNIEQCAGHFGHIELHVPVYHVGYIDVVKKLLSCVCYNCSRVLTDPPDTKSCMLQASDDEDDDEDTAKTYDDDTDMDDDMDEEEAMHSCMQQQQQEDDDMDEEDMLPETPSGKEYDEAKAKGLLSVVYEQARKVKQCPHPDCRHPMPKYIRKGLNIEAQWKTKDWDVTGLFASDAEKEQAMQPFTAHRAYNILRWMDEAACRSLGLGVRPENMILVALPVPPPCMRPTIMASEGSRERGQNDLTRWAVRGFHTNF